MSRNELTKPLITGMEEIRNSWGWFLAVGIFLMLLGASASSGTSSLLLPPSWFLDGCC